MLQGLPADILASWQPHVSIHHARTIVGIMTWCDGALAFIFANNTTKKVTLSLNTSLPFWCALQLSQIPSCLLVLIKAMSSSLLSALTSLQENNYVTRMSIFTFERLTSQCYQSLSLLSSDMIMVSYRSIWTWKRCTNFYIISPHIFQRGKILTSIEGFFMADDSSRSNTSGSADSPTICQCIMSWWCHRTNHGPGCPYHSFSYVLHFPVSLWKPAEDWTLK